MRIGIGIGLGYRRRRRSGAVTPGTVLLGAPPSGASVPLPVVAAAFAIVLAVPPSGASVPTPTLASDSIAPTFTWAVSSDGTYIDGTANEACDQTSTPAASAFSFGGTLATPGTPAWQSATVLRVPAATHRIMGPTFSTVTVSYTAGASPIRDLAFNNANNIVAASTTNSSIHAPMVYAETLYASGNWTAPSDLYGTTCLIEWFPAGEGGTTATSSGESGGYANKTDTIAAGGVYAYTIGAAGAVAGGDGGDCTWRTNVCVGGGGGTATAQIGDVTRARTVRALGAGTNASRGAPGTTSAGSGANPGAPNGGPGGTSGINTSRRPGSGGGSTASAQRTGGEGLGRVTCLRHPPLTGPYVVSVTEYRDTALATTRPLAVLGTHQAGDTAVCLASLTGAATPTCAEATFSHTTSLGTTLHASVFAFDCDGTDTFNIVSTSSAGAFRVSRIRGSAGAASVEATGATGSTTVPTPVTHTPTGGSMERQVVAFAACTAIINAGTHSISGHPAGYPGLYTPQDCSIASVTSAGLVSGSKRETAASYTPAAFGAGTIPSWACVTASIE